MALGEGIVMKGRICFLIFKWKSVGVGCLLGTPEQDLRERQQKALYHSVGRGREQPQRRSRAWADRAGGFTALGLEGRGSFHCGSERWQVLGLP